MRFVYPITLKAHIGLFVLLKLREGRGWNHRSPVVQLSFSIVDSRLIFTQWRVNDLNYLWKFSSAAVLIETFWLSSSYYATEPCIIIWYSAYVLGPLCRQAFDIHRIGYWPVFIMLFSNMKNHCFQSDSLGLFWSRN